MPRAASFAVVVLFALGVVGAVHYYVWLRLVSAPGLPAALESSLTALVVFLFLSIPLTFYMGRVGDMRVRRLATTPGYVWMGVLFIAFACLVGIDVLRLAGWALTHLAGETPAADPDRRLALARLVAAVTALVTAGATVAALRSGLGPIAVKEVRVRLARLPKALDGTVIVQISDIHVGAPTIERAFVERLVARVNELRPDVVAITGDLVDGPVRKLREHVAPLAGLSARYGAYFVTGNHEYYSGADAWCNELPKLGVRVLRNERVSIGDERTSFDLAGIDDHEARRFGGQPSLERALSGRDRTRELVLLAHQPRAAFEAERHGVGLQLSGHTHGGQIWPWNYMVYLQQPIVAGLARVGETLVYVSSGTGYWGPPMRLGAPAEITRLVLESGG